MQKDGVVPTEYGLVMREDRAIQPLSRELEEFKLFSPLKGFIYLYDEEWGGIRNEPDELNAHDLCQYEDGIQERIGQERLEEEGERGLAVYLGNRLLRRKVFSMDPAVESWDGKLWGVLKVKSHGPLSPQELSGLMEEWQGQESDGWGKGLNSGRSRQKKGNSVSVSGIPTMTSSSRQSRN